MDVIIENVRITLTESQVAQIEAHRKARAKCRDSFQKMLVHFGFVRVKGEKRMFTHITKNWFAEIVDYGRWSEVWMTGTGLKTSSFPGGWSYSEPSEIEEELLKALDDGSAEITGQ